MNELKIIASFNQQDRLLDEVLVPVGDRAFMFGDAVYEVLRVYDGQAFLLSEHMARLSSSLRSMRINFEQDLSDEIIRNIAINQVLEGMVYLQISRGEAPRSHSFHKLVPKPNTLIYTKSFPDHPSKLEQTIGIKAITHEDLRWSRCDIKTTNLLANCLIQTHAHDCGAAEALLIRNGMLTEGTSCNVFLVKDQTYLTPPLSNHVLAGTRRKLLLDRLKATGRKVVERPVDKSELFLADEIFITSTVKEIVPVIELDDKPVGRGYVGNHAKFAQGLIKDAIYHGRKVVQISESVV